MAAGFAAGSHLDLVLSKLSAVARQDAKKSSGFLDFFKVCFLCQRGFCSLIHPNMCILKHLNIVACCRVTYEKAKVRAYLLRALGLEIIIVIIFSVA